MSRVIKLDVKVGLEGSVQHFIVGDSIGDIIQLFDELVPNVAEIASLAPIGILERKFRQSLEGALSRLDSNRMSGSQRCNLLTPNGTVFLLTEVRVRQQTLDNTDERACCTRCGYNGDENFLLEYDLRTGHKIGLSCCGASFVSLLCLGCREFRLSRGGATPCTNCQFKGGDAAICQSCHKVLAKLDAKGGLCKDCCERGYLVPYSTDVARENRGKVPEPLGVGRAFLLGVELEVIAPNKEQRLAIREDLGDHAMLKADASLSPGGIEIVTTPLTLEDHFLLWKPAFENSLKDSGVTINETCGLHVHQDGLRGMTKGGTGTPLSLTMAKSLKFIHREGNKKFLARIAGRFPNRYCEQRMGSSLLEYLQLNNGIDHHSAFTASGRNRGRTYEMRAFAATLDFNILMARLEFCQALFNFSLTQSSQRMTPKDFTAWLIGEPFPFLKTLLEMREKWPKTLPGLAKIEKRDLEYKGRDYSKMEGSNLRFSRKAKSKPSPSWETNMVFVPSSPTFDYSLDITPFTGSGAQETRPTRARRRS